VPEHSISTDRSGPTRGGEHAPVLSDPAPWFESQAAATGTQPARVVAGVRPVRTDARAAHESRTAGLPSPATPFGPPGRGVVAGASGVASASATTGMVAALLAGFILLLAASPLRRHRLLEVVAMPVGFAPLLQRPG
jgi:hypothetical protein